MSRTRSCDVVATGPHLVVADGVDVEHLGRLARDGVEARGSGPDVAVVPLLRCRLVPSTTRGAWSRYFAGTCASNMSAGSPMWSSTLMRIMSSLFTIHTPDLTFVRARSQ